MDKTFRCVGLHRDSRETYTKECQRTSAADTRGILTMNFGIYNGTRYM